MAASKTRREAVLEGMAIWGSYYRENIDIFVEEYLHLDLRLFQKILLVWMNFCSNFVFCAARGIGKTFLCAIFCVVRCVLFPGSKIVIASGTRSQSMQVFQKIQTELIPRSPELANEIDMKATKFSGQDACIMFKNTSWIKIVTANDNARSNRANILVIDEYRMVSKDVIDTVLKRFLTSHRMPEYSELSQEERKEAWKKDKNKTLYLSSAYYKDHWSFGKLTDSFKMMLDENRSSFVCGLPYELSIEEGLLYADDIQDEMLETGFNEVKFQMELECLWFGDEDGSFFDFENISKNRRIKYPMLPDRLASKVRGQQLVIPKKQDREIRILSADIALMQSTKHNNDATAIFIQQMVPTKTGRYINNIVYTDVAEGLHTEDQALMIRKLYDEYQCDYIVIDTNGIGLGVYDALVRDIVDSTGGEIYPALSCCNDDTMAARCTSRSAEKVIWSIKGNTTLNSDCAVLLREGFKTGKIRLLVTEYDGENNLSELSGYSSLSPSEKIELQLPYINTTLLINELVKLQHDESTGKVKVYERANMRKDRYSALSYGYYVAIQLETKAVRKQKNQESLTKEFIIRPPKTARAKSYL